jgi:hypothetical protein
MVFASRGDADGKEIDESAYRQFLRVVLRVLAIL